MRNAVKVLIVDDDKNSANMLSEVVKRMGMKPIVASKAVDGLNVAKLQTVHAAVVDVLLPKMSGVDMIAELRKTKFENNPVVIVSGVFRDKTFREEALKKTAAVEFLFKPLGVEELQTTLSKALADLMTVEKMTAQSMLMRKLSSPRECAKAIEQLEKVRGQEFPFVLSILMEARLSGHLNIVSDSGEIFGVTLSRGTIAEVDSTESQSTGVLALISNGFLSQEDWDEFQRDGKKRFALERLVQEGLVSPHGVAVAKHEQILDDFRSICSSATMQLNFGPQDDDENPPKHAVTMQQLLRLLARSMDEFFPEGYLGEFYSVVLNAKIQATRPLDQMEAIWGSKLFSPLTGLRRAVEEGGTIAAALQAHPDQRKNVLQCLHYLVLSRNLIFDDVQQAKAFQGLVDRYKQLALELEGKSPDRIFEYFGGSRQRLAPSLIEKVFSDYEKSNGPDQLPKDAPAELVELCTRCMRTVQEAKAVMMDEEKRTELFNSIRAESAQNQKRANELVAQGLDSLRKGQFRQAADTLREADQMHPSNLQYVILSWALIKGNLLQNKSELHTIVRKLDAMPAEDRKSSYWHMAMGLAKKDLGDPTAPGYFERILKMDESFIEARRELNARGPSASAGKEKSLNEFLHGDITEIVSQLFRGRK